MARIDLRSSCGFPIIYDGEELQVKDFSFKKKIEITIDDVRSQLLNKELNCPQIFYKKYKGLDNNDLYKEKGIKINFYVLPPNLAGIEFVKTRATRCAKYPRIFDFAYGNATVLIQKYISPRKNRIIKVSVRKKDKIIIPPGYEVVVVNTRQNCNLIFAEYYCTNAKPRVVLDERNGLAYYIIRKNAKQEVVRNPSFKIVNEIEKVDWDKIRTDLGITPKTPINKQIMRKYEKFDWLFKEDFVEI